MNMPLLVLDAHFLCHRAFHTSGHLSYKGRATGVVFGFLKTIGLLKDEFSTDRIAFCFEGENLHRKQLYPDYKLRKRGDRTPDELIAYNEMCHQIAQLRDVYLPKIGFKNVFSYRGFESDDIMAQFCVPNEEDVVVITSDSDLYQCLKQNIIIYSPTSQRRLTDRWFRKEYGIEPSQWAVVKAMSGCSSDNVKGVPGVGEKTALRYLRRELSEESAAFKTIMQPESIEIILNNRRLVQLPFEGCPVPQLKEDNVTREAWLEVTSSLGMRSLAGSPPVNSRKLCQTR